MSDEPKVITAVLQAARGFWLPTMTLRYLVVSPTEKRLQQLWEERFSDNTEWRDVPIVEETTDAK